MKIHHIISSLIALAFAATITSCREDEIIYGAISTPLPIAPRSEDDFRQGEAKAALVLCEGNMGSGRAALDAVDYVSASYFRNIFEQINPKLAGGLGDVANDVVTFGSHIYIAVNCSHLIEIVDAQTLEHVSSITLPSVRYLLPSGDKLLASAYVGGGLDANGRERGIVAEIDTSSFAIVRRVSVGLQPEEMAQTGGYIYVANSGGFAAPAYDSTLSVISPSDMVVVGRINVAKNLHRVRADREGRLWVSSRGDYGAIPSALHRLSNMQEWKPLQIETASCGCASMDVVGDSVYVLTSTWDSGSKRNTAQYILLNASDMSTISESFIHPEWAERITTPYALAIDEYTREIYVTDAKNYLSSGRLHCFAPDGTHLWDAHTSEIPSKVIFVR